mmetsp:Transcript_26001/g.60364  ORF Transcript_26001/g.60364 Transcript_26001/m.60364 type:complete len:183 (+) Transcript_26001:236-784(+)
MAPRLHAPPPSEDEISGSPPQMTRKQVVSHCTGERKETTHGETPRTTTAEGVPCRRRNGLETREKSDHARDVHDVFNLVALFPIIVLTISNWDWDQVKQGESMEDAWSGAYFMEFWSSTLLYFLVDLMWVARVPICVKSPGVIVKVCAPCLYCKRLSLHACARSLMCVPAFWFSIMFWCFST